MRFAHSIEKEADRSELETPALNLWEPKWIIDVGHECMVGLTIDDGCFVALLQNETGQWCPTTHIPKNVAIKISEIVEAEIIR